MAGVCKDCGCNNENCSCGQPQGQPQGSQKG